jgi:CheY-like chemotaxis protein
MPAATRILLLNSEPTFRLLLQFRGYETAVASSYQEAREMLAAERYHLIIVQIEFEREAALRFCDDLKQSHPQLKIELLAPHTLYIPPSSCPDDVIVRQDGPRQVLQHVDLLVAA